MTDSRAILVFDVNETVLDIEPLAPLFADWFGDGAAMRTWFAELIVYSQTLTLAGGYVDFATLAVSVLRMVAGVRGVRLPEDAADRLEAQMTSLPAHDDVMPALGRMRDAGLRLVTLTNSGADAQQRQLDHADIAPLFDRQYSVETVKAFKPHPSTYAMVAAAEGVALANLALVACHGWDTIGARLAGCRTAFIARPGNVELQLPATDGANYTFPSLHSLADAFIDHLERQAAGPYSRLSAAWHEGQ